MKQFGILMLAAALATPVAAQDLSTPPASGAEGTEVPRGSADTPYYQVKPGDVLGVQVLEDPSLSSQVLVRPDGRISLPIAGSVMAEGRSPERLEAILRSRLSQGFELSPTVTVSVIATREAAEEELEEPETVTYYMLGQVARPGPITVETEDALTLLQALAVSGGPGPFADTDALQLRRTGEDGVQQIILFDYSRIEDGEIVEDIELLDGDLIFFPERSLF